MELSYHFTAFVSVSWVWCTCSLFKTPVFISVSGMVYMSSSALDWCPILKGWLNHRAVHERDIILGLFEESFPDIFRYAIQNLVFKMEVLEAFVITQVISQLITNNFLEILISFVVTEMVLLSHWVWHSHPLTEISSSR